MKLQDRVPVAAASDVQAADRYATPSKARGSPHGQCICSAFESLWFPRRGEMYVPVRGDADGERIIAGGTAGGCRQSLVRGL